MVKDYNIIKNDIIESGKTIYWLNLNGSIILVSNNKNESKKKLKKMNNISGIIYRFNLSFHSGKKPGQGGPLALTITTYNKEENNISKVQGKKNGIIWFDKEYLELRGWLEKFINMTFIIINKKTFEFKIGMYNFSNLL